MSVLTAAAVSRRESYNGSRSELNVVGSIWHLPQSLTSNEFGRLPIYLHCRAPRIVHSRQGNARVPLKIAGDMVEYGIAFVQSNP
jgi:hypothetical protein